MVFLNRAKEAMKNTKVAVVGAGIVGTAAAIWLKRAGLEVTLIDRQPPGRGASFGNGGILAACSVVPVTTPGLLQKAPGYALDPSFPLFMRWREFPRLLPWLMAYLGNANDRDTRRISLGLRDIVGDSVEQHKALSANTPAETWIQESDYSYVYRNRSAFDADKYAWDLRRQAGFVPEQVEGPAVQEVEPILSSDYQFLAVNKQHGFILSPGSYVSTLAEVFVGMGGQLVEAEVKDFDISTGRITAVETAQTRIECDAAVLSAGVWSKALMDKLGLNVPMEPERGYHVVYKNPSITPRSPMMLAEGKFVATPMEQGLRCAGVVEFGGLSETASSGPLKLLREKVHAFFPDLRAEDSEEWLGFRPAPTDSLPLIGEIGQSGIFTGFGHHHIGLTGGPKTGRLVADLIAGRHPNCDMTPFHPQRFNKRR